MIHTALVIAGGQGSRMATTNAAVPKPLIRVLGIPLIALALRHLQRHGVESVHVAVRHRADEIERWLDRHFGSERMSIRVLRESDPLGTVGALAWLRGHEAPLFVVNSDLLSGIDLTALAHHHEARAADLTIATHWETLRLKLGEVDVDDAGMVRGYHEKPLKRFRISSGTYVVGPSVLRLLGEPEWMPFPVLVDRALDAGLSVESFDHGAAWLDVNDEADLREAERRLSEDPVAFGLRPDQMHAEILRMGIES